MLYLRPHIHFPFSILNKFVFLFNQFLGERFGRMQVAVAIVQILRSFVIEVNGNTPKQINFSPDSILLRSTENIDVTFVEDEL